MADFKGASLWLKLALLMTSLSYLTFHMAFLISGWGNLGGGTFVNCDTNGNCNDDWYTPTEFCMVVGFILHLLSLVLILCLVLLDELSGNKPALIVFIVCSLVAGVLELVGLIIFIIELDDYTYSSMDTVISALVIILAGIFGILEVAGVKKK